MKENLYLNVSIYYQSADKTLWNSIGGKKKKEKKGLSINRKGNMMIMLIVEGFILVIYNCYIY
jgi:hypothetical protein